MSTPRQFLEVFLQEIAAAYAETNQRLSLIHERYFGNSLLHHADTFLMRDPSKAIIEDVKQADASAVVITREPAPRDTILRQRYHLAADGESWRIVRMDRQCFLCGGTGQSEARVCPKCHGEGWYDR